MREGGWRWCGVRRVATVERFILEMLDPVDVSSAASPDGAAVPDEEASLDRHMRNDRLGVLFSWSYLAAHRSTLKKEMTVKCRAFVQNCEVSGREPSRCHRSATMYTSQPGQFSARVAFL